MKITEQVVNKIKFLSFLGTGNYSETVYSIKKKKETIELSTRFCQLAVLNYLVTRKKDPVKIDEAIFFLTDSAKKQNWTGDKGLSKSFDNFNQNISQPIPIKAIDIVDGNNKAEIWKIFDIIVSSVDNNDILFVDITHAFRFLPMLLVIVLGYLKYIKDVDIGGIFYGAFEARDKEKNITPILELSDLYLMYYWVFAVKSLLQFGDTSEFKELLPKTPILFEEISGTAEIENKFQDLNNKVNAFTNLILNIRALRGPKLQKCEEIGEIQKITALEYEIKPLTPLFGKVREEFKKFTKDSVSNGIIAARWAYNHNLIQVSVTLLEEFIIQSVIEQLFKLRDMAIQGKYPIIEQSIVPNPVKKPKMRYVIKDLTEVKTRNYVSSLVSVVANNEKEEKWCGDLATFKELTKFLKDLMDEGFIKQSYNLIGTRNDLNHAGFGDKSLPDEILKQNINNSLSFFEKYEFNNIFKV